MACAFKILLHVSILPLLVPPHAATRYSLRNPSTFLRSVNFSTFLQCRDIKSNKDWIRGIAAAGACHAGHVVVNEQRLIALWFCGNTLNLCGTCSMLSFPLQTTLTPLSLSLSLSCQGLKLSTLTAYYS